MYFFLHLKMQTCSGTGHEKPKLVLTGKLPTSKLSEDQRCYLSDPTGFWGGKADIPTQLWTFRVSNDLHGMPMGAMAT